MCPYKLYLATLSIYSQNISLPTHTGIFSLQSGQRARLKWSNDIADLRLEILDLTTSKGIDLEFLNPRSTIYNPQFQRLHRSLIR
jgi:hypothetical protein